MLLSDLGKASMAVFPAGTFFFSFFFFFFRPSSRDGMLREEMVEAVGVLLFVAVVSEPAKDEGIERSNCDFFDT